MSKIPILPLKEFFDLKEPKNLLDANKSRNRRTLREEVFEISLQIKLLLLLC